jgi:hypothetical protein
MLVSPSFRVTQAQLVEAPVAVHWIVDPLPSGTSVAVAAGERLGKTKATNRERMSHPGVLERIVPLIEFIGGFLFPPAAQP